MCIEGEGETTHPGGISHPGGKVPVEGAGPPNPRGPSRLGSGRETAVGGLTPGSTQKIKILEGFLNHPPSSEVLVEFTVDAGA